MPSFVIALILFTIIGFSGAQQDTSSNIAQMQTLLAQEFNINWIMLVPLVALLTLAIKKMPAFPAVAIGALLGGIWAVLFQPDVIQNMLDDNQQGSLGVVAVVWTSMFDGVVFSTADENLNALLSRGGMSSMLNTIWLIICAMSFGAVLERTGLLKAIVALFLRGAKTAGSMISRTIFTCIGTNIITADQYISIVMPGRMYKEEYAKRGLHQLNLSRSLEDGGTITSPLIPWNTCGAYMQGVLLVHPFDYFIYTFFNLINPVLAIIYAYLGVKILRIPIPDVAVEIGDEEIAATQPAQSNR